MNTQSIIILVQKKIGVDADGRPGPITWGTLYKTIFGEPFNGDTTSLISAIQAKTGATPDGEAGSLTWQAIYNFLYKEVLTKSTNQDVLLTGKVDDRSERCIASLLPELQGKARALVHLAANAGAKIKIISGLRTYEEQNELYAQGRTRPGNKVTNARGGFSNHNFGLAFDIGVYEGTKYMQSSPKYKQVASLAKDLGLSWGGDWKTFKDEPHFELRPSWAKNLSGKNMLAELRRRKEENEPFFA